MMRCEAVENECGVVGRRRYLEKKKRTRCFVGFWE